MGKTRFWKNRVNPTIGYTFHPSACQNGSMNIKKLNYGESYKIKLNLKQALMRRALPAAVVGALALAGCVSTPHTTIEGTINGSPFVIEAPKDGDLTGFDLTAETNGAVHVHIDHLAVKMNPDVIGQTGAAQTAIIAATGEAASNITQAAVTAALRGAK